MGNSIKSVESLANGMKCAKSWADGKEEPNESLEEGMNKPEDEIMKDPKDNENEEGGV